MIRPRTRSASRSTRRCARPVRSKQARGRAGSQHLPCVPVMQRMPARARRGTSCSGHAETPRAAFRQPRVLVATWRPHGDSNLTPVSTCATRCDSRCWPSAESSTAQPDLPLPWLTWPIPPGFVGDPELTRGHRPRLPAGAELQRQQRRPDRARHCMRSPNSCPSEKGNFGNLPQNTGEICLRIISIGAKPHGNYLGNMRVTSYHFLW